MAAFLYHDGFATLPLERNAHLPADHKTRRNRTISRDPGR